jgi:glycosyltransferase involved in cell wall biosynthesis
MTIFNNYAGYQMCIKKGFKIKKAVVIQNAVEYRNPIYRTKKEILTILSVGRFEPVKDYFTALKAIKHLKSMNLKLKYYIIGWGSLENEIKNYIQKNELSGICNIVVNPRRIEPFYQEADIFLQTSLFEGLSNTILEAMCFSLPVVASDVGDISKIIIAEKNGFLCETRNHMDFAKKLNLLIENYNLRNSFGKFSFNHVNKNFSYDLYKKKYLTFLNDIG